MHQINPQLVFDAKDRPIKGEERKEKPHPLDVVYQRKITNRMVEVPRD